jgi:acetyl esterase/lipase
MQIVRRFGYKHVFGLSEGEMRRWLEHGAIRRSSEVPWLIRTRHRVYDQMIAGYPCPIVRERTRAKAPKPVVLFLHGGGFIFEALFIHWLAVDRIIMRTGAEVWFAAYPLLPKATIYESHDMVLAAWRRLTQEYDPGAITIVGDSAGATLALTLTHALRAAGQPLPRQLILSSPAQARIDPHIHTQMEAFAPLDVIIPLSLLDVLERLMPERPDSPPWLLRPLGGDGEPVSADAAESTSSANAAGFLGFPPTMVLAGTHEIFYPLMPDFLQRLADSGVPTEFVSGEGLCHGWPYIPAAPECIRGLDRMIAAINRG